MRDKERENLILGEILNENGQYLNILKIKVNEAKKDVQIRKKGINKCPEVAWRWIIYIHCYYIIEYCKYYVQNV